MKKNKKIVLIEILLIVICLGICLFLYGNGYVKGATSNASGPFVISLNEEKLINSYKNIYNVEYGQKITEQDVESSYKTTSLAQIRGENVTFTNYEKRNAKTTIGKTCIENNIMAAIVTGAGVQNTGYKYTENETNYYSGAQLAIWEFWNTWVENSDAKANGFEKGIGNATVEENGINGESERKKAQALATQNTYNANIYFLEYVANGTDIDNQPNLILIENIDEDGDAIEFEKAVEPNSGIYIMVSNNVENIVKIGEEIVYNVNVYNENEEEQQEVILINKIPKGVTFTKIVEVVNNEEIELNEKTDYNYNEENRKLTLNISKIDKAVSGTMTDEETGEESEYIQCGSRQYKITVKVNKLKEGIYSKEIVNVAEIQKEDRVLARNRITNIISDAYLEIETDKLPEIINEEEEYIIGLKITNKGLIAAENVNIKVSIPEEISMQKYKISTIIGNEVEASTEGTVTNIFEKNYVEIPAQTTIYIQLKGKVDDIEETKSMTIEGNVNEQKINWTTSARDMEGGY